MKEKTTKNLYLCELVVQRIGIDGYEEVYYYNHFEIPKYILAYRKITPISKFTKLYNYKDFFNKTKYRTYNDFKANDGKLVVKPISPIVYSYYNKISDAEAIKLLNSFNHSSKNPDMKEYLENFKKLAKEHPEEAKKIATEVLIETGVLDENGNYKEQIVTEPQCGYSKVLK